MRVWFYEALIVAHPDDEIIWFSPQDFDLIVITFLARHDKPYAEYCRKLTIEAHPLKDRIILLGLKNQDFGRMINDSLSFKNQNRHFMMLYKI